MSPQHAQRVYTVSELTEELNCLLEDRYSILWINGEISNFKISVTGHCYFTLKDKKAQLQCVIFRIPYRNLKFSLKDGLQVTALGRLSIYPPRGSYQLIAEYIEPRGRGALQAAYEELKAKLEAEGLFADHHKRQLPFLPCKISVITSPSGAVRHDIETVIRRRFPNMRIELVPVSVQGREAAGEIVSALRRVDQQHTSDVIILARGGGSLEDLQPFNSEAVARAIYELTIPLVSAVGHETDYTIADFTADLRAPTPSVAAELVVPLKSDLEQRIAGLRLLLLSAMKSQIEQQNRDVDHLTDRLRDPRQEIAAQRLRLDDQLYRLKRNMAETVAKQRENMNKLNRRIDQNPLEYRLLICNLKHEKVSDKLSNSYNLIFNYKRDQLDQALLRLESASPQLILKRGYSITRLSASKKVLSNTQAVKTGDSLEIILYKGRLQAVVTNAKAH